MRVAPGRPGRGGSLRRTVAEVVEGRHAVCLRPQADRARAADMDVLQVDVRLAIQRDADLRLRELDAQRMPHVARNRCIHVLKRVAPPVRRVIERDVVLERVGACDVVVVPVFPAPYDSARLVLPALERLELDLDEAVLDRAAAQHAPWEGSASGLLQHVGGAWRRGILAHAPAGVAFARAALFPRRGQGSGRVRIEVDGLPHSRGCRQESAHRNHRAFHVSSYPGASRFKSRPWTGSAFGLAPPVCETGSLPAPPPEAWAVYAFRICNAKHSAEPAQGRA